MAKKKEHLNARIKKPGFYKKPGFWVTMEKKIEVGK